MVKDKTVSMQHSVVWTFQLVDLLFKMTVFLMRIGLGFTPEERGHFWKVMSWCSHFLLSANNE